MEKLVMQLIRLYLMPGMVDPGLLARHVSGEATLTLSLANGAGGTRAIVFPFDPVRHDEEGAHWTRLCELAHVLQARHGFPAPGVSASAKGGYRLWVSLAAAVPVPSADRFVRLVMQTCFPDLAKAHADRGAVELPPCRNEGNGRWSAFINPGMGASFIGEAGLEMQPPPAAQAAFLERLEPVEVGQFDAALQVLEAHRASGTPSPAAPSAIPQPASVAPAAGLLLRDATLEDIVRHLHAKNIEPTFRHLLPG